MHLRRVRLVWFVLVGMVGIPALASAQSAIAGLVKDTSGSVLPGVIVEASSPVLIEQSRTVVTDEGGRYNIVNRRPGTYKITFSLSGFSNTVREASSCPPT